MLCQVCQIPMAFTESGDPTTSCVRTSEFRGERFNTCSDGCKWIFEREPEKYVQAWLPVHQIYQGNCGGPTDPRRAGLVRHRRTGRQRRVPDLARTR